MDIAIGSNSAGQKSADFTKPRYSVGEKSTNKCCRNHRQMSQDSPSNA